MRYIPILSIVLSLSACLGSCQWESDIGNTMWYNDTKAEILKESNLERDSITWKIVDSAFIERSKYCKGHRYYTRGRSKRGGGYETYFSNDGNFELRHELYNDTTITFAGIFYKGKAYGRSTWYYPNGTKRTQGVRFNDVSVGIWKEWDSLGHLLSETAYNKDIKKLGPMPKINKEN